MCIYSSRIVENYSNTLNKDLIWSDEAYASVFPRALSFEAPSHYLLTERRQRATFALWNLWRCGGKRWEPIRPVVCQRTFSGRLAAHVGVEEDIRMQ